MANVKITELTALTDPASSDVLPIVDVGADTTKKVTIADLLENAGDGAAATPAFSFDNDKSVGMWRPGSEQLAFSTSGTTRLFINSSGNIGVNTSSPSYTLHVNGRIAAADGTASTPSLTFASGSGNGLYYAGSGNVGLSAGGSEKLRITSGGNLGIGTTSPSQKLDVEGPSNFSSTVNWNFANLYIRRKASNIGTAKMISMMLDGDSTSETTLTNNLNIWGTYSGTPTTGSTSSGLSGAMNLGAPSAILLHTNGSERMQIDSSGNVGIGTASPTTKLHVNGGAQLGAQNTTTLPNSSAVGGSYFSWNRSSGSAETNICNLYDNASASFEFLQKTGASTASALYNMSTGRHIWYISNSEKARIDNSGRLGVGTSSPEQLLHIESASSPTIYIKSASPSAGTFAQLEFGNGTGATSVKSRIKSYRGATSDARSALAFETTNTSGTTSEALRINHEGRVGIGTTSPDSELHISKADTTTKLILERTNSSTAKWSMSAGGGSLLFKNEASSTEAMRLDSSGRLLVGTSSTATDAKLLVNGTIAWADENGGNYTQPSINGLANGGTTTFDIAIPNGTHAFQVTLAASANGGDKIGGVVAHLYTSRYGATVRQNLQTISNNQWSFSSSSLSGSTLTITVTNSSGYTGYQGAVRIIKLA